VNLDPANESFGVNGDSSSSSYNRSTEDDTDVNNDTNREEDTDDSHLPYDTILDVTKDIINLESVMTQLHLGPNGGLVYCMEYIEQHLTHLLSLLTERLSALDTPTYLLFDLPGQVELYTHNTTVQNILSRITKELDVRLCAVQLIDGNFVNDASNFIGAVLLATTTMLRLELPAVNVLSKIDLVNRSSTFTQNDGEEGDNDECGGGGGGTSFNLDFYTNVMDPARLLDHLDNSTTGFSSSASLDTDIADDDEYQTARQNIRNSPFHKKYRALHAEFCDILEDFNLVSFVPLDIMDATSVGRLLSKIDTANGYVFLSEPGRDRGNGTNYKMEDMFGCAVQADQSESVYESIADVQERYMKDVYRESIPELET